MYHKYRIVESIANSVSQYESYRDQVYRYTPKFMPTDALVSQDTSRHDIDQISWNISSLASKELRLFFLESSVKQSNISLMMTFLFFQNLNFSYNEMTHSYYPSSCTLWNPSNSH